ncbi:uncharacterized protein N7482_003554 [Penicillium canariense]|uniref:LEA domain protein n=1 Tax=Penicillium canariense TaxID=189055 RepID=A0A9W9I7E8_9EURO|nr:uncharacterized protein N7482_003554 [Penicillium canariense]KAJ5167960.1 hypothetical protein N7482_003554 [Penicillium canariense]
MSTARLIPVMKSRVATCTTPRFVALRSISSTARYEKGPVDATKDTLKKADRIVSDVAVKGIDKGKQASEKIKDTMGTSSEEAKAKAQSKAQSVKGEAEEYMGKGKGEAEEVAGKAKGKLHEMEGKAKEAKRTHIG